MLLTVTEFKLVNFLATRVGQDVGYRELYDIVRGAGFVAGYGEDGFRSNVRAFIKRIRRKFRERQRQLRRDRELFRVRLSLARTGGDGFIGTSDGSGGVRANGCGARSLSK